MTAAFFDSVYRRNDHYYGHEVRPRFAAFLASLRQPRPRCLDLGSGQGRHAVFAARAGVLVHAVDYSPVATAQLAAYADAQGLPITAECADVTTFTPPPAAYDGVVLVSTLSHFDAAAIPRVIDEAFKALVPGGQIYVEAFTVEDPGYRHAQAVSETAEALRHYYPLGALREAFSAFAITDYQEMLEDDFTHGPAHQHGVAILVGTKPQA